MAFKIEPLDDFEQPTPAPLPRLPIKIEKLNDSTRELQVPHQSTPPPASNQPLTPDRTEENKLNPLFTLPPELRARIYTYALGGKTVHVNLRPDKGWLYVCQASTSEDEAFEQHEAYGTAPDFFKQHRLCEPPVHRHALADEVSLSLLGTCRAIYHEAVRVPFAENTFVIRDSARLQRFAERLSPVQQRAVQDIVFVSQEPQMPPRGDLESLFRFSNYTGLRRLRIRMEFVLPEHESGPNAARDLRDWAEALLGFAHPQLSSAKVITYRMKNRETEDTTQAWAVGLEKDLMEKVVPAGIEAPEDPTAPDEDDDGPADPVADSSEDEQPIITATRPRRRRAQAELEPQRYTRSRARQDRIESSPVEDNEDRPAIATETPSDDEQPVISAKKPRKRRAKSEPEPQRYTRSRAKDDGLQFDWSKKMDRGNVLS